MLSRDRELTPEAEAALRGCLLRSRVAWLLTLLMPAAIHYLWPWFYDLASLRASADPHWWGLAVERPVWWTGGIIGVFAFATLVLPRWVSARWRRPPPLVTCIVEPSQPATYRAPPSLTLEPTSVARAVRWACARYSVEFAATLAALNLLSFVAWLSFANYVCGGHWGCFYPPPTDYVPLLVAAAALTVICMPTRGRVVAVLTGDHSGPRSRGPVRRGRGRAPSRR